MPRKKPDHVLAVPGSTGYRRSTNRVLEEWHPQLFGRRAIKKYREMFDNDPIIGGGIDAIEDLIRQASWEFKSRDESSSEGKEWAEAANKMIHDMESSWQEFLSDVLLMLPFGWALFVDTYKIRRGDARDEYGRMIPALASEFDDGLFGWRDFEIRDQATMWEWDFDQVTGRPIAMVQMAPPFNKVSRIPLSRAMLFRLRHNKGSPEGRSLLRRAYRSWYMLKRIQEIEGIGVERDLAGMPIMEVPPAIMAPNARDAHASARSDWEEKIQKVRMDQMYGLVIPAEDTPDGKKTGYRFRLASAGGRRPIDVNEIIKRYESRIAISLATEFQLLGQDKTGSYSMHSDKTSLFSYRLGGIMDTICETINKGAVSRLMHQNDVDRRIWPILEHGDVEREKAAEVVRSFLEAAQAGLVVPTDEDESLIRTMLDFPQRGVDDNPMPQPGPGLGMDQGPMPTEQMPTAPTDDLQMGLFDESIVSRETQKEDDTPAMWTVTEAADHLRVSELTIRNAIRRGQLPGNKVGNSYRVDRLAAVQMFGGRT